MLTEKINPNYKFGTNAFTVFGIFEKEKYNNGMAVRRRTKLTQKSYFNKIRDSSIQFYLPTE